ncbi:MAG: type II toxin-antitoxin system PemK/MazF family toxin [Bacillota bacterium]
MEYQWGIFWADLEPVRGSEQAGTRPVLVISAEEGNQALPVVSVIPLTAMKPGRRVYSIEALLPAEKTGLPKDSIAMTHQVRAIAKERLGARCGHVAEEALRESVRKAIRLYLDL